ncbi:MAG: hypothetical protein IRY98_10990 [Alicyclobacillaceae bacterium]|nr:hypothetical protein [Alicyclobacillaceae bacterium]
MLTEALEGGSRVRITLFGPDEDEVWEGVPVLKNGRLYLEDDTGKKVVPVERVVGVDKQP